ncbi:MAG: carboxymuconolactone decarboxylase family protein [Parvibaculum sp.]|nr:carboxymuconolactone decarboxylase family protein [Parvibaculum sp.]
MARLTLVDPETTSGDVRAAFDLLPVKLNIFRMMAHAETCMAPLMRLGGSILALQQLGARERELVVLQAAALEGGAYEWRQHVPIAKSTGVTDEQIAALEAGTFDSHVFNEAEQALLAFSRQVVEDVRVEAQVFAAMRAHFSEREIVETILAIGFYMMMARLTEATETDLDPAAGTAVVDSIDREELK